MPQEFYVLKCYQCETFQVHIIKKSNKWECKMCGEKQSIKKIYAKGPAKDCRLYVQKLNLEKVSKEENIDENTEECSFLNYPVNENKKESESISPIYAKESAKDCRLHAQKLNLEKASKKENIDENTEECSFLNYPVNENMKDNEYILAISLQKSLENEEYFENKNPIKNCKTPKKFSENIFSSVDDNLDNILKLN